jgi:hypothetical protein
VRHTTAQAAHLARDNRNLLLAAAGAAAVVIWLACRRTG